MTVIKPIGEKITTSVLKETTKKITEKIITSSPIEKIALAGAVTVPIFSTVQKDFNKTVSEDNYFQLKIDPKTDKPYNADIFQRAAAINLFLGNDVLVTAPTGTGKTAIALYAMTKNFNEGVRTFYTTPLKALSNEKFKDFKNIFGEENVGLITGDTKINTQAPIIVMTTEVYRNMAAGGIFNNSSDSRRGLPEDLKTVIFDELQYLGDIDRGGIWEQSIMYTPKNVQMLSLSATIGNNQKINSWMAATKGQKSIAVTPNEHYTPHNSPVKESVLINVPPEKRHVPLEFEITKVVSDGKGPRSKGKTASQKTKENIADFSQAIYARPREESYKKITEKLYKENKLPAIYFVFSKKESRFLLNYLTREGKTLTTTEDRNEISQILKKYAEDGIYLGESLHKDALMKGYAIHNSGLLPSQKGLIEELFQKKLIKVVIATETLSAGINMPAKTTVISSPRKPGSTTDGGADKKRNLTANEFHQMAGRAGRRGIDTIGYCIPLSCNPVQFKLYENLEATPSNKLDSNLDLDYSFIANFLANASDEKDLRYLLNRSLYTYDDNRSFNKDKADELYDNIRAKKEILIQKGFLKTEGGLSKKGELLKLLNGYEQIPIIELIANKNLQHLNTIQLAGILGGLANIEINTRGDAIDRPFELKGTIDDTFAITAQEVLDNIKEYSKLHKKIDPTAEVQINTAIMEHLYSWAELNSKEENSKANWKELYTGELKFTIRDEGSLFREIATTIDLVKQLINISKEGERISKSSEDKEYFNTLTKKLTEVHLLLQKEPVDMQY